MPQTQPISYNELAIGQAFTSAARTLTETHLVMFTMLVGDWHPIHSDELFAEQTPVGKRMFHGTFGISLAMAMSADLLALKDPPVAALGISDWSFKAPLFIGDTVHTELIVTEKRTTRDGKRGIVTRQVRLLKSGGAVAQEGKAALMVALS